MHNTICLTASPTNLFACLSKHLSSAWPLQARFEVFASVQSRVFSSLWLRPAFAQRPVVYTSLQSSLLPITWQTQPLVAAIRLQPCVVIFTIES